MLFSNNNSDVFLVIYLTVLYKVWCFSVYFLQGQRLARADGLGEDLGEDLDDADAESEGVGPASAGAEEGEEEEVPVAVVGGVLDGKFHDVYGI